MVFKLPATNGSSHFPIPTGSHTVGCVDIFSREREGKLPLLYRLYYPTADKPDPTRWLSWLPHLKYKEGYASSILNAPGFVMPALGSLFSWLSSNPSIPANEGSEPSEGRFPLVVFSHGLIGCRTTYSTLCADLASQGYFVAAVEHGDNSANARMVLKTPDGKPEWIEREVLPKGAPEDELRARQITYRTREVVETLDSLEDLDKGEHKDYFIKFTSPALTKSKNASSLSPCQLSQFKGKIGVENSIISGHSMGGATTVRALTTEPRFKGGVALDAWMFPVRQDPVELNKEKLLFINFEKFQGQKNLETMSKFETKLDFGSESKLTSSVVTLRQAIHYACTDLLMIFQGTYVGGLFLSQKGQEGEGVNLDPYQSVLANSSLFQGWMDNCLKGEVDSLVAAYSRYEKNLFSGIENSTS